jgi:hypothetical protein
VANIQRNDLAALSIVVSVIELGYCEQEVLVDRLFAFLHVLSILFGLLVDPSGPLVRQCHRGLCSAVHVSLLFF